MSVGHRVKLDNVQLGASGMYKCEVIGEGPEFLTSDKHAKMMVVSKYVCVCGEGGSVCVCLSLFVSLFVYSSVYLPPCLCFPRAIKKEVGKRC